jgi:large subunit ribosomal protein L4
MNKKEKRAALKSALTDRLQEGKLIVLDELKFDEIKTKAFVKVMDNLKIDNRALFVLGDMDQNVILSARNVPDTKTTQTSEINVYDIMNAQTLILTKDAVAKIEEVYA